MKQFFKKLGTFILSLVLLAYVILQIYPLFYSSVSTETVNTYSAYETLNVDCVAIRNEVTVPLNTSNYVFYTVQNGTRVANGGAIAQLYGSKNDALVKQQIEELDTEIAQLKQIQTLGASGMAGLDILNTQIDRAMTELVKTGYAATTTGLSDLQHRLLGFFNKKQTVTGKAVDFSARIQTLEAERNALSGQYKSALGVVKAPAAGYFVDRVDGFETILTVKNVKSMTCDNIHTALQTAESTENTAFAGKIVRDYTWYIACVVPGTYATTFAKDKEMHVRFPLVSDEELPVKVVGCNRDESGELAVVFECVNMSETLSVVRKEKLEILLVEHTGLRVPKRAITTNEAQQVGVYIRSGDIVRFRKVDQKYSEAADYVICALHDETEYLQLYDDVIVEGSKLYDGKLIR